MSRVGNEIISLGTPPAAYCEYGIQYTSYSKYNYVPVPLTLGDNLAFLVNGYKEILPIVYVVLMC